MNELRVGSLLDSFDASEEHYDLALGSLGYESRSAFIPTLLAPTAAASHVVAFADRHVLSFDENREILRDRGVREHSAETDQGYGLLLKRLLVGAQRRTRGRRMVVAVDVSSMSRPRIASTIVALGRLALKWPIRVDFLYAPAAYSEPLENEAPIIFHEPVLPEFAGWSTAPDRPVAAVFGLGYERDKAVGVLEYLEPVAAWAYLPSGEDDRYDARLQEANEVLMRGQPRPREIHYAVRRPFELFASVESLMASLISEYKVVLVPMGPKVFALCSMLAAYLHSPIPSVWRFSSGPLEVPSERVASGHIVGLRCEFRPTP